MHNLLTGFQAGQILQILLQRLACHCHATAVEETFFKEILEHSRRAADRVQIFHHELAAGLQIRNIGHSIADFLEVINRQWHFHCTSHRDQMEDRIG